MKQQLSIRQKLLLALGLVLLFLPVLFYVNMAERSWAVFFGKYFGVFWFEFALAVAITFGWLFWAEFLHAWVERLTGVSEDATFRMWPSVLAVVIFLVLNTGFVGLGVQFIFWAQVQFFDQHFQQGLSVQDASEARFANAHLIVRALFVFFLLTYLRILRQSHALARRAQVAQKQRLITQYNQLKSRVNPHFLFNNLSTLSSLVWVDAELSEQFIDRLSKAYRYMLEHRDVDTVPVAGELEFFRNIAFLMSARFGDKFKVEINITDNQLKNKNIVPCSLQFLTEQAFKHNRMSSASPLVLRLRLEECHLVFENTHQPRNDGGSAPDEDWDNFEKTQELLTGQALYAAVEGDWHAAWVPLATRHGQ